MSHSYIPHTYGDGTSSRSLAAQDAESEGRLPLTRAIVALRAKTGKPAKECRSAILRASRGSAEWHHTGSHARRTPYYKWDVDIPSEETLSSEHAARKARIRAEMDAEKAAAETRFAPLRVALLAELSAVVSDPPAPWESASNSYPDGLLSRLQRRDSYHALGCTLSDIKCWTTPSDIRAAASAAQAAIESQPAWQSFLLARAGGR